VSTAAPKVIFEESSNLSGKRFPVLLDDQRSIWQDVPGSIPWEAISAHEPQARANHGRSLDALAQRGGLSPYELLAVLFDQPFWRCSLPEPATVIKKLKEKTTGF
jgi:hypothetical protein